VAASAQDRAHCRLVSVAKTSSSGGSCLPLPTAETESTTVVLELVQYLLRVIDNSGDEKSLSQRHQSRAI
jgi:hypothetical protein